MQPLELTYGQAAARIAAVLADLDAIPASMGQGTHHDTCWQHHAGCLAARIRRTLEGTTDA